jgi:hypothetical protein
MRIGAPAGEPVESAPRFNIDQVGDEEGLGARGELVSDGIGQWAVDEELDYDRGIEDDHRWFRNSRMI